MRKNVVTVVIMSLGAIGAIPHLHAQSPTRQRTLQQILLEGDGGVARVIRGRCATIDVVANVARARAEGEMNSPEALDTCVAAMTRQARMGISGALYQDLLSRFAGPAARSQDELLTQLEETVGPGGNSSNRAAAARLPPALTEAITSGRTAYDLGQGRSMPITSGLAFDIGFMGAYENRGEGAPGPVNDEARFRVSSEQCLTQRGDSRRCLVLGFVQGARAYATQHRAADAAPMRH